MLRACLFIVLTVVVPQLHAEPLLSLDLQTAWAGTARAGSDTELSVQLLASRGGSVEVSLPDHTPGILWHTRVEARTPHTIHIPVRPGTNKPLQVVARLDDTVTVTQAVRIDSHPGDTRLVATALQTLDTTPLRREPGLFTFAADTRSLPHLAAGYASIYRLIIDPATIAALDKDQLSSLSRFVRACGRVTIIEPEPRWFPRLQEAAGCNGAFVTHTRTLADAQHLDRQPRQDTYRPLPKATTLAGLLTAGGASHNWHTLMWFFACYAASLALLAWNARKTLYLFLAPAAATLLALLAWSNNSAERELATWSEMGADDASLRFSALLNINANGKGEISTRLPEMLGLPVPGSTQDPTQVHYQDLPEPDNRLVANTHLQAVHRYYAQGTAPARAPMDLVMTTTGPVVSNPGTQPSPAALLGWQGQRTPVPALQPGENWRPPEDSTPWNSDRAEERLLRSRTQTGAAALLTRFKLIPAQQLNAGVKETGWLLIHSS